MLEKKILYVNVGNKLKSYGATAWFEPQQAAALLNNDFFPGPIR